MKPETPAQTALRVLRNWIEREARQYPGARSRCDCRERLRQLHGWQEKQTAVKSEIEKYEHTAQTKQA